MPLQDSDNFIIGRGTDSYKITYEDLKDDLNYVPPPVLNLEVGKGSILPSINLEEGDTLTGLATVIDAENPVEVHVWELDGVEVQRGSSATYVADAGQVRYRKEVTDDNNQSPVVGEWSDAVTVAEVFDPTKPDATMHGLRFDSARDTNLIRPVNISDTFTMSVWVKPTDNQGYPIEIYPTVSPNTNNRASIFINADGTVAGRFGDGVAKAVDPIPLNQWSHLVVSSEGTQVKLYIGGNNKANAVNNAITGVDGKARIGMEFNNSDALSLDGYLSDLYFVDGQALPPETFGKSFEGKWGPLDSSKVKENIGFKESPADNAPNMAKEWSSFWSGTTYGGNYAFTNVHDAAVAKVGEAAKNTNCVLGAQGQTLVFAPDQEIPVSTSVSLRVTDGGGAGANKLFVINEGRVDEKAWYAAPSGSELQDLTATASEIGGAIHNIKLYAIDSGGGNSAYLAAVIVDGRALVDGPADNSQVWSKTVSAVPEFDRGGGLPVLFSGTLDADTGIQSSADTPTGCTLTFANPIEKVTKVEIGCYYPSTGGNYNIYHVNSETEVSTQDLGDQSSLVIYDGPEITLSTIFGKSSGPQSSIIFGFIKVNDKLLVDSPPAWDMSQVWSNQPSDLIDVKNLFDGNLSTYTATTSVQKSWTMNFSPALSGAIRLRVGSWNEDLNWSTNEDSGTVAIGTGGNWYDITTATAVTELTVTRAMGGAAVSAIEVAGKILVDQGSFGANGFYLPFDPAATGENYSTALTSTVGYQATGKPGNAFDGSLTTAAKSNNSDPNDAILSWTGDVSGSVFTFYVNGPATNSDLVVNEGLADQQTITTNNADPQIITVTLSTGSLKNFKLSCRLGSGGGTVWLYGITADGALLVDHNSIGVDNSGNGNDFHDENFAAGNTDEVWSSYNNLNTGTDSGDGSRVISNIFNSKSLSYGKSTTGAEVGFTGWSIPGTTLTVVWSVGNVNDFNVELNSSGSPISTSVPNGSGAYPVNYTIPDGTLTDFKYTHAGPDSQGVSIKQMLVDGVALIDANIQDTVTDTPMRNYAVLESTSANITLSNGNLVGTTSIDSVSANSTVSSSSAFYFEVLATSNLDMVGLTMLPATNNLFPGENDTSIGIHGNQGVYFNSSASVYDFTFTNGDLIGCAYDSGKVTFYKNGFPGSAIDTNLTEPLAASVRPRGSNTSVNFGQQPFTYELPDGHNTLYQTWEQYARTTLGYALDRIAKLEKLRIEDAETIANLRTMIDGALSRISSIESDEVNDDAVDNSLITLVGSLSSQITAWSQRIEQAETALSDITDRVTTLEL